MNSTRITGSADAVVVGGGTIGAWCAWFLRRAGLDRVVLLEAAPLGKGASSRAAGMVRAQGGTETAVRLGMWTPGLLRRPARPTSASTRASSRRATACPASPTTRWRRRTSASRCSRRSGLDVRWVDADEFDALNPAVAPGRTLGSSYAPGDGYIDPPRNVLAYTVGPGHSGVEVHEGTAFTGLETAGGRVSVVHTDAGSIATRAARAHRRPAARRGRSRSPASGSRPVGCGTRSSSPSRTPTWPRTGCRWSSTSRPASTGGPRRAGCCGG